MCSFLDPQPHIPKTKPKFDLSTLGEPILQQMVARLNATCVDGQTWMLSHDWCQLPIHQSNSFSPLVSQAFFYKRLHHKDVIYATCDDNPSNSVVQVLLQSNGVTKFGRIVWIFKHQRFPEIGQPPISELWASIEYFQPMPRNCYDPFKRHGKEDMQVHLCQYKVTQPQLILLVEIVSHCA